MYMYMYVYVYVCVYVCVCVCFCVDGCVGGLVIFAWFIHQHISIHIHKYIYYISYAYILFINTNTAYIVAEKNYKKVVLFESGFKFYPSF